MSYVSAICSDGFHYFSQDNICFGIFGSGKTFWDALDECVALEAELASIETDSENTFVGGKSATQLKH